jgi:hypothetical protein
MKTHASKYHKECESDHQQVVKLDALKGIAYKIAEVHIRFDGKYFCLLDGIKTKVIA